MSVFHTGATHQPTAWFYHRHVSKVKLHSKSLLWILPIWDKSSNLIVFFSLHLEGGVYLFHFPEWSFTCLCLFGFLYRRVLILNDFFTFRCTLIACHSHKIRIEHAWLPTVSSVSSCQAGSLNHFIPTLYLDCLSTSRAKTWIKSVWMPTSSASWCGSLTRKSII